MQSQIQLINSSELSLNSQEEVFLRSVPTNIRLGEMSPEALRLLVYYVAKQGPFELAVDSGYFKGSLSEWLQSLKATFVLKATVNRYEDLSTLTGLTAHDIVYVIEDSLIYYFDGQSFLGKGKGIPFGSVDAYAVAKTQGFTGTVTEWLESLKAEPFKYTDFTVEQLEKLVGPKGDEGKRGLSAYEIAIINGFKGTAEEWLASLHGASAYTIAVAQGFDGSINAWVNSLKGADGKSAYELEVLAGYEGTLEDWILKPNRTTAEYVLDASGETQQQVNYNGGSKWYSRVGGYQENERVVLDNGNIVESNVDGNANDPNVDMTGWVNTKDKSYIGLSNVDNTSDIDKPLSTATNLAIIAANQDKATKQELATSVAPKADKTYVDTAIGAISTDASKQYATLALAEADISNIALNKNVFISEAVNGGYWYKATAEATTLTRSPYDPVEQAKVDINKKISDGSINQFNFAYLMNPITYTPGGTLEQIITENSLKFKYTHNASSGVNGFGFSTRGVFGSTISATIDLRKVDLTKIDSVYISQWNASGNLGKNLNLENLGNGVFTVQKATVDVAATYVRLFVRSKNIVGQTIEFDFVDLVFDAYSRYVDESISRATLLNSNTINLINASELLGLTPFQIANVSRISTQVNELGSLIGTITKATDATHNAGTRIDVSNINNISFGIWVKDNPNFISVELWKDSTPPAHVTLSTPRYSKDGWNFYSAYGIDVSAFSTYEFRVRFNGTATDTQFKNPVFTTNPYSVNWIPQELSEVSKNAIVAEAVDIISPMIPTVGSSKINVIPLDELYGLDKPSHSSNTKDVTLENDGGVLKYKWFASTAPTVSSLGFFIGRVAEATKYSASVKVKNTESIINVQMQQQHPTLSPATTTSTMQAGINDGQYTTYYLNDVPINPVTTRIRFFVRMTGVIDEQYEFIEPFVTFDDVGSIPKLTYDFISQLMGSIVPNESEKDKFNNIAQAVAWIKNPLIHSGAEIQPDGSVLDVFDQRYFSIWGSSSAAGLYSRLNTYAINTLGCESTFNGGKGGESGDLISARIGARPCRILFTNGSIPDSGSIEVQHTLGLGFGLSTLQAFSGKVSVFNIEGTLSYDSSVSSNLIFTRTTTGSSINVPSTMYFDFIPSFDQKYLNGYGIVWVGKNDIGWGNQFGSEELLQRTIETFSQFKPLFKRTLVFDHWANTSWDQDAKWIEIQKINSLLKQYFGKYLFSVHDYVMSEQVWVDTGITPTPADLILQSKRMLASSLSSDGQHLNASVNDQLILKLDAKYRELGWI